jgi:phosphoserine phosphatase RsbU/P
VQTPPTKDRAQRVRRLVLLALAVIFAGCTVLFTAFWMIAVRWNPPVELGFDSDFEAAEPALMVKEVRPQSPAERAGLQVGDRILALDDAHIRDPHSLFQSYNGRRPGESVQLTVRRGQARLLLTGVFRPRPQSLQSGRLTPGEYFGVQIQVVRGIPFVVVGLAVLFFRLDDRRVWLMALLSGSLAASGGFPGGYAAVPTSLRPLIVSYQAIFLSLLGPLFYWFLAVFPSRSPVDRRFPWLKWLGLFCSAFFGLPGLGTGNLQPPAFVHRLVGDTAASQLGLAYTLLFLTLGLVALGATRWTTEEPEARRKMRVVLWGTLIGVGPAVVYVTAENVFNLQAPFWLRSSVNLVTFIFPLSFAYAVVRHRVLEIPVLLQRSARYLLVQRGFTILMAALSTALTLLFALSFERFMGPIVTNATWAGVTLGVGFGTVLLWTGGRVHQRVSGRIDRAFFRDAYDARMILQDLTEKPREATSIGELVGSLQRHIERALHPRSLVIYVRRNGDFLAGVAGPVPPRLVSIRADLPELVELARSGKPWEVPLGGQRDRPQIEYLNGLDADCLVPLPGRKGDLFGLVVLGPRLSEEPYSGEDKRLLAAVGSQAGVALENIRLAEKIAEQMEAERRTAREMEIAKEVQRRLLPQAPPPLLTLDCACKCVQARSVGGDYFDFLELRNRQTGFVVADVSGKGVHAALLVANLQAQLRSQSRLAPLDPVRLLQEVNQALWASTAPEHYVTLFFAIYDDVDRSLRYVNCGHNPPVLLRSHGALERLPATATVVGLFERWESDVVRIHFAPGDVLAVFSDGITEASRENEEFGEDRLLGVLAAERHSPAAEIVRAVLKEVERFGEGAQSDDLTILVLRSLP